MTLNPKLEDQHNLVARLVSDGADDATVISTLFSAALCRTPTVSELKTLVSIVAEYEDRATALQDVAWSILTSAEFTFNH